MPNKKEQNAAVNPRGAAGAGAAAGGDAYDAGSIRVLENRSSISAVLLTAFSRLQFLSV